MAAVAVLLAAAATTHAFAPIQSHPPSARTRRSVTVGTEHTVFDPMNPARAMMLMTKWKTASENACARGYLPSAMEAVVDDDQPVPTSAWSVGGPIATEVRATPARAARPTLTPPPPRRASSATATPRPRLPR